MSAAADSVMRQPVKRSVSLRGHRTSVTLEPLFWATLETMAAQAGQPLAGLIADIDAARDPSVTLTGALRCRILAWALENAHRRAGDDNPDMGT